MFRSHWTKPALLLIAIGVLSAQAYAPAKADQQFAYIAKVLTFDRNLKVRAGDGIVIGILYQDGHKRSRLAMEQLERSIDQSPLRRIRGLPFRYVPIRMVNGKVSAIELTRHSVDVLYVTPLSGVDIRGVAETCREFGVTSWTGVSSYVEAGLAVAVVESGGKPQVVVNLPAARAEGANFSSQLLKLARVVS